MNANNLFHAAFGIAALLAAAGNGQAMGSTPDPLTVTQSDAGKSFTLAVGQRLNVHLSAQFGTGYSWLVAADSTPLLNLENSSAEGSAAMPGGAQLQLLVFSTAGKGKGTLKLEYRQPWVKDVPAIKSYAISVTIGP